MSQVQVVERYDSLPYSLKMRVAEELARGKVRLPLEVSNSRTLARLDFRELARALYEFFDHVAAKRGIHVYRDPVVVVESWADAEYRVKAFLPCRLSVELRLVKRGDEAEVHVYLVRQS